MHSVDVLNSQRHCSIVVTMISRHDDLEVQTPPEMSHFLNPPCELVEDEATNKNL